MGARGAGASAAPVPAAVEIAAVRSLGGDMNAGGRQRTGALCVGGFPNPAAVAVCGPCV